MDFEWDETKRQSNIEKHQVDLLDAVLIFESWVLTERDERFDSSGRSGMPTTVAT